MVQSNAPRNSEQSDGHALCAGSWEGVVLIVGVSMSMSIRSTCGRTVNVVRFSSVLIVGKSIPVEERTVTPYRVMWSDFRAFCERLGYGAERSDASVSVSGVSWHCPAQTVDSARRIIGMTGMKDTRSKTSFQRRQNLSSFLVFSDPYGLVPTTDFFQRIRSTN